MQGNGTVNHGVVGGFIHVCIHGGVRQAEDHSLVTHQRLVVGFHIGHGIFTGTAQAHISPHLPDVPVLVLLFLHRLDPHIRETHAQAVIKADAAVGDGQTHAGHAGHIFRDGDGLGIDLTNQLVGQLQVGDGFCMGVVGKIFVVGVEISAKAMVVIEHGGHAVEPEAVEMVLRHPELQVA